MAHVLGSSGGGIRRHVRYLAARPPDGYETLGVWGPADLGPYFAGLPFNAVRGWRRVRSGADVVHVHGLTPALPQVVRRRTPVVLTVHTDIATQGRTARSSLLRALARVVAARANAVIAVSARVARSFPSAHTIAPAVEPLPPAMRSRGAVRAELGTPPERTVIIAVARLHRDKGLDRFIEAVTGAGEDVEGWICGEGPERESLLALIGSGRRVRLLGQRDDVADLLGAADIFALASVGEAYGIAVSEAIAAGLPVVVSEAGAMAEIAGGAGLVVPPQDGEAFAKAVHRLIADEPLRRELSGRARTRRHPDAVQLVTRVGEVYDEVCR